MAFSAASSPLARLITAPRPSFEQSAALTKRRYRSERLLKALGPSSRRVR